MNIFTHLNWHFVAGTHAAGDEWGGVSFAPPVRAACVACLTPCTIQSGTSNDVNMCLYSSTIASVMMLKGMVQAGMSKELNNVLSSSRLSNAKVAVGAEERASIMLTRRSQAVIFSIVDGF